MNRKAKAMEFLEEGYDIKVTGRHVEVTEAMKQYALEKISKIERFINRIIDVNVIMDIQKLEQRVEIIMRVNHTKITSQASSQDMYASIDKAVAKLEAQLRRYKTRLQDHHAKALSVIDMNVNVIKGREEEEDFDLEESADYTTHEIVKQDTLPLKTLTNEEAVMKMDLSKDMFMIFKNEADQKIKVIYRRDDGNYGIIEPHM